MSQQLFFAAALVFGTVFIHGMCTAVVFWWTHSMTAPDRRSLRASARRSLILGALVLLMSVAAYGEAALWAGFYWWAGALPDFREAHYFSLVTFTTLGYGDVTLDDEWQLLGAFQAANGIIMFGWTTALIVAIAQRLSVGQRPQAADR